MNRTVASIFVGVLALLAACGDSAPRATGGLTLAADLDAELFADGFTGPTQMIWAPNGDLIVAELNGGENDAAGRVIRVSVDDVDDRSVLQTELDKPTGIAIVGDRLWIMERRRLSVTSLDPGAARETVADELPFNGRSEGTLTVTAEGQLLYNTSGSKRGADRVSGSATLFTIDNAADGPGASTVVATGFKHAYAHLVDPAGQLWTVEMTDGNFDDQRAPDELVAITVGDDAGWPQCVGNNRAVIEYGGTAELCASSPQSHAIFGVGATPTSIVVAPWDDDLFVVALWLPGTVVTVPRGAPTAGPHEPVVIIDGIESPQHLLVDGNRLLVSDHATGQIFSISHS